MYTFEQMQRYGFRLKDPTEDADTKKVLTQALAFTDRDSYLKWVRDWKGQIEEQMVQVRDSRSKKDQSTRQLWRKRGYNLMLLRLEAKLKAKEQVELKRLTQLA